MKMESMARFLIKGDIILHNRKKYEVVSSITKGEETTIVYKTLKSDVFRLLRVNKSEFFRIISPIPLNSDDNVR